MAHQLEQMAYVGETPWHGLGNQLTQNQPIEVWAQQAGMDWRIESSNVSYMAQNERGQSIIMPYEEQRVLYRSDTHAPLSVVSQRYQEVQPKEILHFYKDLTEQSGFELETAGVLKGGKKFWALARTGQTTSLKGKDVSNGYILLATACDGTLATTAQFTSIRVVCNNTLAIALKGQNSSAGVVKVPHSTKFDAKKIKQQLGISVRAWEDHMYEMKQLSQRKVTQQEAAAYFDAVFNNTSLSIAEQDDSIIQFYRNVANQIETTKTAGEYGAKLWRDGVPLYVLCQVQHQLAVTGKKAAHICVLICGHETRIFKVTRSESVIQHIINAERYFWECVEKDTPPEADASESAAKALQLLYPEHVPLSTTDFTEDTQANQQFEQLIQARNQIEKHQEQFDLLKHQLQAKMQQAERATFTSGSVTWKKAKDSISLDSKALLKQHPEYLSQFPQSKQGSWRFNIYTD